MCRFVLYQGQPLRLASLVTEPVNSIINQSFHSREQEEPLNGDGFGVAWYVPEFGPEPAAFRSLTPAWNNRNLLDLARVTRSGCVLAHVRAATQGLATSELNCHPFTAGRYAFMHNGDLDGFPTVRRALLEGLSDAAFGTVRGNTDSEHIFAAFLDRVQERVKEPDRAEALAAALEATIHYIVGLSRAAGVERGGTYLNIALSDGERSAACRFSTEPGGGSLSLSMHTGRRYVCEGRLCRMVEPERGHGAVLISSEPLSDDPGWQTVPHNHIVVVRDDLSVEVRAVRGPG